MHFGLTEKLGYVTDALPKSKSKKTSYFIQKHAKKMKNVKIKKNMKKT